jgi:hypothetical protein
VFDSPLELALAGVRLVHLETNEMLRARKIADARPEGVDEPVLDEEDLHRRRDVDVAVRRLVDDRAARRVDNVDRRRVGRRRDGRECNEVRIEV